MNGLQQHFSSPCFLLLYPTDLLLHLKEKAKEWEKKDGEEEGFLLSFPFLVCPLKREEEAFIKREEERRRAKENFCMCPWWRSQEEEEKQ